ncbi:RsmB/NOP family class I SAM-dependent RNA methyltransferase [Blastococcus sp. Marseille-P5729]|uniref:RsmB/NOP family class I SAM-dependent RNA methyltransferase n=1 Tax=Blastococcus sp. Marseille-P5729 TaxID=2086582 RepID=UPI000D0F7877|nr:transcription antitermination factor NusB [Blastococcus sp. Marseille-P5729]
MSGAPRSGAPRSGASRGGGRRGGPRGRRLAVGAAPRRVAYEVVRAVSGRDAYANLVLPDRIRQAGLDARDAALATELTYGTLRAAGLLDAVIDVVSSRPVDQLDDDVRDAVRLGAYQLLRTRIAPHAAVSATVGATHGVLSQGQAGFVNALLRKIGYRTEEEWVGRVAPDADTDPIGNLAMKHAHPRWIAAAFNDALGGDRDELAAALAADDERPAGHLAARPGRVTRDELAAASGGTLGRYSPYAVHLDSGDPAEIAYVRSGSAAVQDEGSQLAALALIETPIEGADSRWVDLCAGPGGKAGLLAAVAAGRGARLLACEPAPHRAALVASTLRGLPAQAVISDGRRAPLADSSVDRVLVDAPCSGLGALRRRPESRWRRQPSDIPALTMLQRELLTSALRVVRAGGVVAYVTCSPHVAETRAVVRAVVDERMHELVDVRPVLGELPDLGEGPWVQLWPHRHGTDAMFISLIRKR